jgi:hypothetical protein
MNIGVAGAVIGAEAPVLLHAPPELGEDHHRHVVSAAKAFDVVDEAADRVSGVHQETAVKIGLLHVRIEVVALIRSRSTAAPASRRR